MALPPLSFAFADSTAVNPATGFLGGGFVFAPTRQLGGSGNRLENTQSPTASVTPTATATPHADSRFGFGPAGASPAPAASMSSLILPAVIIGAALVFAAALRK